ncbi:MAG: AMP-binding protein, partial [Acidimicrobiales bacterium]
MPTIADLVREHDGDPNRGLAFEDTWWTWAEVIQHAADRASLLESLRRPGPFHLGILMDNIPEFPFWLCATALVGAVVVGINPTRRGRELERDITHTDCQLIITEAGYLGLLDGLDLGEASGRVLDSSSNKYAS